MDNEDNGTDIKPFTKKQVGRLLTEIGLENMTQQLNNVVNHLKTTNMDKYLIDQLECLAKGEYYVEQSNEIAQKKELFGNIDVSDSFFDTFRPAYPGFEKWFNSTPFASTVSSALIFLLFLVFR